MNVLSVFDGMSCGRIALERAGINVNNYYASEIDKHAVIVSENNYPDIMRLGDVTKIDGNAFDGGVLPPIDLFIGGSPCQGFSFAGKQLNFDDPRSKLFWEYVRILKELKVYNPDIKFMLENVRMKKEYLDVITDALGVEPVMINSALVSAQNRKRYFWTNILDVSQPIDKGIMLTDIVHETFNGDHLSDSWDTWFKRNADKRIAKGYIKINPEKAITMTARQYANWNGTFIFEHLNEYKVPFDKTLQILDKEVERGKVGFFNKDSQSRRVYYIHDKAVTLCGDAGGGAAKMGQYLFGYITPDRINKRQNGQRFSTGNKFYTLTAQDKHGILIEGYIRKLTPIEAERLQTVPDNFTAGVSDSQRYRMLGNGWTVDVIAHIFEGLK